MSLLAANVVPLARPERNHNTHVFSSLEDADFDLRAYSRMKFGSGQDARILGREMAEAFAAEYWHVLTTEQCVVIPAPSTAVPVAATLLGWHFRDRLNSLLDSCDRVPVQWDLVHRDVKYNDNYSQLGLEDRRRLLDDDGRYMNVAFAAGKTLIFVDDVKITGTHEVKLGHMLQNHGLHNSVVYATYAVYTGDQPSIEHELNHCYVRNGLCVARMSHHPEWCVTTRGLRLLLESSPEVFQKILHEMSVLRLQQVYHAAITKGYSKHPPYAGNFQCLRTLLGE